MMMKRGYLILPSLLFQCLVLMGQENPDQFPEPGGREENYLMRVTARVVDEKGVPVAGASIRIGIHNVNDFRDQYNDFLGKTDEQGRFSAEAVGRPLAKIEVNQEGYYPSRKTVTCYEGNEEQIRKAGRYSPWNPTIEVMTKKIGKPAPMIVRLAKGGSKSRMKPAAEQIGTELSWDLVEGDWVAPNGKGKVADFFVKFESGYVDQYNRSAKVRLEFGNNDDGCIPIKQLKGEESLLEFPRLAPEKGYIVRELEYSSEYKEVKDEVGYKERSFTKLPNPPPKGYMVRLRTKRGENDNIVSAIYCKITSPFELDDVLFQGRRRLFLNFDYYLNPTPNDRNLEYDQRNNLAPEADRGLTWPP